MSLLDTVTGIKKCSNPLCPERDPSKFNRAKNAKDGLNNSCRACQKVMVTRWRTENKDRAREISRKWRKANPDKVKAKRARLRKTSAKMIANELAYREKSKVRRLETARAWIAANPEKKLAQVHRRRANKMGLPANYSGALWNDCLVAFECLCAYCGKGECLLEQDHFVPLSARWLPLGMDRPGHVPWNIVPACMTCNRSKVHHNPMTWLEKQGYGHRTQVILEYLNRMREQFQAVAA